LILQQLFPVFQCCNPLVFDLVILSCFIALNMLHMKTGSFIQAVFTALKLLPIIIVIALGVLFIRGSNFIPDYQLWAGIPLTLPLVVYALLGFEVACSLSAHIKNAQQNAPRVIFISYALAVSILVLFQLFFYGIVGS